MALVFQYGSNASSTRLNASDRLRGDARVLGLVHTRESFELEFDVWSSSNGCATADIREGVGRAIWGVLYEIPDSLIDRTTAGARRSLDAIEGSRYQRRFIGVQWPSGTQVEGNVITYTVRTPEPALRTSFDYTSHIVTGLRNHGAPEEYIAYVKSRVIANNPALAADIEHL